LRMPCDTSEECKSKSLEICFTFIREHFIRSKLLDYSENSTINITNLDKITSYGM
jgi:hypothetical protein